MFKHKIKEYFFYKIMKHNDIFLYYSTLVFTTADIFFL